MRVLVARLRSYIKGLLYRSRFEREVSDELQFHIQTRADDLRSKEGLSREEAIRKARIEFGSIEKYKDEVRESRGLHLFDEFVSDLRYAFRQFLKAPIVTITAILTIALGIGANVAIFKVVNAFILRPLPYKDSGRLVLVDRSMPRLGMKLIGSNYEDFADWKNQVHSIENLVAYRAEGFTLTTHEASQRLSGSFISSETFHLLGVQPAIGYDFSPEDDMTGKGNVVLVSDGLWRDTMGGDPNLLGSPLKINGQEVTLIGVMPPGFRFPESSDLWMPLTPRHDRGSGYLRVIGRLRKGINREQAQTEMEAIVARLTAEYPKTNPTGEHAAVLPLQDVYDRDVRPALLILLGAVGFVLLIACANVAHLLLAQAALRQREIAIRNALGASRARLTRQLITEGGLLVAFGGALGFMTSLAATPWLIRLVPERQLPFWFHADSDWRVVGFAIVLSLLAAVGLGLVPMFRYARSMQAEQLTQVRGTSGRHHHFTHKFLIASEIALALVLCIGAGLLIKSFGQLERINPGFDPQNVISAQVILNRTQYPQPEQRRTFFSSALRRFASIGQVESAAGVSELPLGGATDGAAYLLEGEPEDPLHFQIAQYQVVSPNYFHTLRIPVIRGRDFNDFDKPSSQPVAIVDETMANKRWPGEDPVGKRLRFSLGDTNDPPFTTVIGVAGNVRHNELRAENRENIYIPLSQNPPYNTFTFVIRAP